MKKRIIDATRRIRRDAATLLGFPWSAPAAPASRATTSSGFVDTVSDTDLKQVYRRNPAAHMIVSDVAGDAMTTFAVTDTNGEPLEKFDAEVQVLFQKIIRKPLTRALILTRLYGWCGLLTGYTGETGMNEQPPQNAKITYLQPIPKAWVQEVNIKSDKDGNLILPPEIESYSVNISGTTTTLDGSRIHHLTNPALDEETLKGDSSLLCVYDDITVLKSESWGFGQSAWRHGGGLTAFMAPDGTDQQTQIDAIDDLVQDINAMTVLTLPHGSQMVSERLSSINPMDYLDVCLQTISIGSRIPVSILRGAVAGSLTASEKDRKDYFELLDNIQKELITPTLINILKQLQATGQLQEREFLIEWNRTPVWMMDEQKGKLLQAQAKLTDAKTRTEQNEAKLKYLEYQERKENKPTDPQNPGNTPPQTPATTHETTPASGVATP